MEDTESAITAQTVPVAFTVTAGSIRWRILKDGEPGAEIYSVASYSGFDPMEDTESCLGGVAHPLIR